MNRKTKLSLFTNMALVFIISIVVLFGAFTQSEIPIISSNNSAIYSGDKDSKNISFMFNVYENTEIVNGIIDVLERNNVFATFFIGGCWGDDNATTLNRIVKTGNEVGNHGYFHKDHKKLSYEENLKEISNTNNVIESLCGVKPILFAPPSGSYGDDTLSSASALNMSVIMWSKDTIDWRDKDDDKIYKRAIKNLTNGDLILMHPKQNTLNVLQNIIDYCVKSGYNIVTVSKNIGMNYNINNAHNS